MLGLSGKARLRLEWIIFYYTIGQNNAPATSQHFGIARSKFYYWLGRFNQQHLRSLEDEPPIPKKTRCWLPDLMILERMIILRKTFSHWGKMKLACLYEQTYDQRLSSWQFQRTISEFKLYSAKKSRNAKAMGPLSHGLLKP